MHEPLVGGSIPWNTVGSRTVSWHPYAGQPWPYGKPTEFDFDRGDWVYVPNRAIPVSGSLLFNGTLTTHNALSNSEKAMLTYLWVDWRTDPGQTTYMDGVPNILNLYSGSIQYVYVGVRDSRDGRHMGLYQLASFTVTHNPPTGSHSGSYFWKSIETGFTGHHQGQWCPDAAYDPALAAASGCL